MKPLLIVALILTSCDTCKTALFAVGFYQETNALAGDAFNAENMKGATGNPSYNPHR